MNKPKTLTIGSEIQLLRWLISSAEWPLKYFKGLKNKNIYKPSGTNFLAFPHYSCKKGQPGSFIQCDSIRIGQHNTFCRFATASIWKKCIFCKKCLLRKECFQIESEIDPRQLNYMACFGTVLTRLRPLSQETVERIKRRNANIKFHVKQFSISGEVAGSFSASPRANTNTSAQLSPKSPHCSALFLAKSDLPLFQKCLLV